jgi:NTE family protein
MNTLRPTPVIGGTILSSTVRPEPLPRQIVTLAFLSGDIPAPLVSEQLARSLCAETGSSVVLVRLEREDVRTSEEGVQPKPFLNGEFHLPPQLCRTEAGFHFLTLGVRGETPTPAGIDSLVGQLSLHFRYVLIETPASERAASWLSELLLRSNLAYLFIKATTENVCHLDLVMRDARARCHNGGVHVKPIVCLAAGEQIGGFDKLAQTASSPAPRCVHGCPMPDGAKEGSCKTSPMEPFRADLRRLAREIGGCLVGLALSSGAAKGYAHIGVIQVLEENGIEVDVIAGTSMGAYVGSLWAYGCDGRELERLARELEKPRAIWSLIDPVFPPRRGFIRGFAVKKRLMRTIGNVHFADLARPLRVVAANLATLERKVFFSGEVAAAVHASSAVPGICVPIEVDGEIFTDGGIVDPLPVDVLREMGITRVIAVNVNPTPERIRQGIEAQQKRNGGSDEQRLPGDSSPLKRQVNHFARGNVLEILMRSVHGAQIRIAEASCQMADLVLRPDIFDDRWLDYRNPGQFIALGRDAAERHLEEIWSLVTKKESIHEPKLAPEPVAAII